MRVHRQGLTHQGVEQAVVRVGQLAVVVKAGDLLRPGFAARRGCWPTANRRPSASPTSPSTATERRWSFKAQQGDGAAAKLRAQPAHQALQAHGLRLLGHQVGENGFDSRVLITISRYFEP